MATATLLLTGDVMTGRGIDQAMPEPLSPELYESWVRDAREYVRIAEDANGPIARPVGLDHVWGDALAEIARMAPDLRVVNLETAITRSSTPWPGKGIHYRMSPAHVGCLTAAKLDACVLANNHVLDWGVQGLLDTLSHLHAAGLRTAGAGANAQDAEAPAVLPLREGARLLLFAYASETSGVLPDWAARAHHPGVAMLRSLDESEAQRVADAVRAVRHTGDLVVVSLHWGENWVPQVPREHRRFAHRLIDLGAADIVHGHSSHHPLPIEVHAGKPILYGCGDLINDYEGITPRGGQRSDLVCLYGVTLDLADGRLVKLELVPLRLRGFRLCHAAPEDREALAGPLERGCRALGTRLDRGDDTHWSLRWG